MRQILKIQVSFCFS